MALSVEAAEARSTNYASGCSILDRLLGYVGQLSWLTGSYDPELEPVTGEMA